ncbi:hypothetical protein [Pedobacter steynii]
MNYLYYMDLITTNNNVSAEKLNVINAKLDEIIDYMIKVQSIPKLKILKKLDSITKLTTFNDYLFMKVLALISLDKTNIHNEYLNHLADNWSSLIKI